jgi:hypothetical protein
MRAWNIAVIRAAWSTSPVHGDTEVIDVFAPPREDFLAGGTPAYMNMSE